MNMLERERERYTDEGKPPLDWERYLEVAPALSGLDAETRDKALAARELDGDVWSRAEGYWTLTLALDLQGVRTDRADAYGVSCAAALQARGKTADATEDTLPEAGADPDSDPIAPLPPPALPPPMPRVVVAPELAVPTFLREAPRAAMDHARTRLPLDPGFTGYMRADSPASTAPSAPMPPSSFVATAAVCRRITVEINPIAPVSGRGSLPFAAPAADRAAAVPTRAQSLPAQSGLTMDLSGMRFELLEHLAAPSAAGAGGRDRRTEAGTVELDPAVLAAFLARKPAPC